MQGKNIYYIYIFRRWYRFTITFTSVLKLVCWRKKNSIFPRRMFYYCTSKPIRTVLKCLKFISLANSKRCHMYETYTEAEFHFIAGRHLWQLRYLKLTYLILGPHLVLGSTLKNLRASYGLRRNVGFCHISPAFSLFIGPCPIYDSSLKCWGIAFRLLGSHSTSLVLCVGHLSSVGSNFTRALSENSMSFNFVKLLLVPVLVPRNQMIWCRYPTTLWPYAAISIFCIDPLAILICRLHTGVMELIASSF